MLAGFDPFFRFGGRNMERPVLRNGLCDLLGIDYPFAWRAWVAEATRLRLDWWQQFRMPADWVSWGERG